MFYTKQDQNEAAYTKRTLVALITLLLNKEEVTTEKLVRLVLHEVEMLPTLQAIKNSIEEHEKNH